MPLTYTAIATTTVGSGGVSSIEFTSIPATYTDLLIKTSLRVSDAVTALDINIKFNTSDANKTILYLSGDGSAASAGSYSSTSVAATGANATANTFSNCEVYFPNYAGSTNKSFSIDRVTENNSGTAYAAILSGLWAQTAAITGISFHGNFVQYSTATLYGIASSGAGAKATGGMITSDDTYYYHTFLSSGTFTPTSNLSCEYLVVAGGGGVYWDAVNNTPTWAGGGGAGGYRTATGFSVTSGTGYTVTVGAGGARGTSPGKGGNSVFSTITSTGGGGGADANGNAGFTGGSGGGGGGSPAASGGAGNQGGYSPVEGYAGGAGGSTYGGGGGGSAAVGTAGTTGNGAAGGTGTASSISGSSVTYAVGGSGGSSPTGDGTANRGNGASARGNGGSGIVIVRYLK